MVSRRGSDTEVMVEGNGTIVLHFNPSRGRAIKLYLAGALLNVVTMNGVLILASAGSSSKLAMFVLGAFVAQPLVARVALGLSRPRPRTMSSASFGTVMRGGVLQLSPGVGAAPFSAGGADGILEGVAVGRVVDLEALPRSYNQMAGPFVGWGCSDVILPFCALFLAVLVFADGLFYGVAFMMLGLAWLALVAIWGYSVTRVARAAEGVELATSDLEIPCWGRTRRIQPHDVARVSRFGPFIRLAFRRTKSGSDICLETPWGTPELVRRFIMQWWNAHTIAGEGSAPDEKDNEVP